MVVEGRANSLSPNFAAPIFTPLAAAADEVRQLILRDIADDRLHPGQRLGAERGLAKRFGVSRWTVRAALEALELDGFIYRRIGRGGGAFVAERRVERDLSSISVPRYLKSQGFAHGARVISTATIEADEDTSHAFDLSVGDPVLEVVRVRYADDVPISFEQARFPAARFPDLLDRPLGGSLQELFEVEYGLRCGPALERIEVITASGMAARVLDVARSFPLVSIVRRTLEIDGSTWELSHDVFRSDRVRIIAGTQPTETDQRLKIEVA